MTLREKGTEKDSCGLDSDVPHWWRLRKCGGFGEKRHFSFGRGEFKRSLRHASRSAETEAWKKGLV